MRVNERMKKVFSILLCLCMVLQYVPTTAFAVDAAESGLCEHHPVHTESCHYAEAVEGQPCTHVHDELCGYIEAVEGVSCTCVAAEDGTLTHAEDCGYVEAVAGVPCTHAHDELCGYAAAVEAHECHYECAECADSNVIANQSADWCGNPLCSQEDAFHVTSCTQYVAPENPKCYCVDKCAEPNIWCDVCGFDYTQCGGTDRSAGYGTGWEIVQDTSSKNYLKVTGPLSALPEGVEYSYIKVHEGGNLDLGEADVTCDVFNYFGTISSGRFRNVHNNSTISGGIFEYDVVNDGTISGGTFTGHVSNNGTITDVTFWYATVSNSEHGAISNAKFESNAKLAEGSTPPQSVIHSVNGEDVALTYNAALPEALKALDPGAAAWYQDLTQVTDGTVPLNYTTYVGEYAVNTAATTNGTVSVPATAKYGQTVTVTATAFEGYVLDTLTVQQGETEVTVTDNKFTMPAANVTVTATFKVVEATPTTYTVTIAESIENGTVTADPTSAEADATITLTVTPAEGYEIDTVSYNDGADHTIAPVEGLYSFTMPAGDVTVTATFKIPVCTCTDKCAEGSPNSECAVCSTDLTSCIGGSVAKVGDTYYTDFATAVANWTDNTTLTLLADVTDLAEQIELSGNGLVLDLNGKKLKATVDHAIKISAGEMTIRDSAGAGSFTTTQYGVLLLYGGNVNFESGTLESVTINKGTFNMTGGTIQAEAFNGIYVNDDKGTANISGGEIKVTDDNREGIYNGFGILNVSGNVVITSSGYAIQNSSASVLTTISGDIALNGSDGEFYLGKAIVLNTQPTGDTTWRVNINTDSDSGIENGVFAIPGDAVTLDPAKFTSLIDDYEVKLNNKNELVLCNHSAATVAVSNGNETHNTTCDCNGTTFESNIACSGGVATATHLAVCAYCGGTYGELDANVNYDIIATAMTAAELKDAVTAWLAAGNTDISILLTAYADQEMFTAIWTAFSESTAADGSINLTISGAKTVPEYGFFDNDNYFENGEKNIAGDKLKSLTLTDVETIGDLAFSACTYLESVNLPQVVTIGECAFNEWKKGTKLTSLNLPNATTIGDWAFAYSSLLTSVNLPKVVTIGTVAFADCDLRTLDLPEATTIGSEAFMNNDNLVSCSAPKATTIGYHSWGSNGTSKLERLELTAVGDFTLSNNIIAYTPTEQIDLVLNKDKETQVTQNEDGTATWATTIPYGDSLTYTFKSITLTCVDGTTNHSYTYTDQENGTHKAECTVEGCGFYKYEAHTPDTEGYTDNENGTHSLTCTVCQTAVTEAHTFIDGVCSACDYVCPHSNFDSATGNCKDCEISLAVAKIKTGETTIYYQTADDLHTAVLESGGGQTITLLADFEMNNDLYFNAGEAKNTLDLNGHTLTGSSRIDVASGELTITGTGSINIFMTAGNKGAKIVVGSGVTLNNSLRSVDGGVLDLTNATIPEAGLNVILYSDDSDPTTYNVSDVLLLPEDYYFFVDGKAVYTYSVETEGTVLKHTEHSYTYTDNGDGTHDATCSACGKMVDNEAHTFDQNDAGEWVCDCTAKAVASVTIENLTAYYANFADAVTMWAEHGDILTLLADVSYDSTINLGVNVSRTFVGGDYTLDLGSNNIVNYGTLTIQSGTIKTQFDTALAVYGPTTINSDNAELQGKSFQIMVHKPEALSITGTGCDGWRIWNNYNPQEAPITIPEGFHLEDEDGNQLAANDKLPVWEITVIKANHVHNWSYTADGSTITATCGNADTCSDPEQSITLAVPENYTYTGEALYSASVDGSIDGVTYTVNYTGMKTNYSSANAPVNADTYTVTLTAGGKSVSGSFTINPKNIANCTAKLSESSFTYDGKAPALTVSVVDSGVGSMPLAKDTDYTVGTVQVNAGSHKLTVTGIGNYTGTVELAYTITAKEVSITGAVIQPVTYDPNGYTLTVTGVTFDGVVDGETLAYNAEAILGNTNAFGEQDATVTVTLDNSNYNLVTATYQTKVTINKAAATVTAAPTPNDLTYTGVAQNLMNAGEANGGTMQYSTDNQTWSTTIPQGTDAGKYTVYYKVVGDENHSDTAVDSIEVTIDKAKAVITVDTTTITVTYGETVSLPTATTNFGNVVCDKTADDLVNAGTYTVTYTVAGTENFEGATKTLTVKVEQMAVAEPTVTGTYTYSGSELTAQLTGVESYMTVASGNKGTNAGNYVVEVTLDGNHKWADGSDGKVQWSIDKAKAEISVNTDPITVTYGETVTLPTATTNFGDVVCNKKASDIVNAGTYTVTYTVTGTDNYDGDTKSITVTVNAKPITVTADALSKTYGEADPTLTYKVEGLVNGDELTGELKRVAGENVGDYAIEQNTLTAGNNYCLTYTGAKLTINTKAITAADVKLNGSLTYNGREQIQPITVTEGITYEVSGNKATNAGAYELTVKGTGNYTGSVTLDWTIAKAKLTITADSKVIYIGEKLPTLTYTTFGLVGGDKLTKEPALTTNADADQAGSYTITAANADAGDNYTIAYVSGSLTIMDKETEVETKIEQTELTEVPGGLKDTQFDTVEEIKEELISKILATSTGYSAENMVHYDVALHFSLDGGDSWILATEENFPTEGITVILPYPEGTNARDYEFVVSHMFTVTSQRLGTVAGEVEMPKVEKTANGIRVTLNGLSPVTVAARYHDHTGGTATCTEKAVCTICGNAYGEVDKTNHAGGTEVKDAKEATCGAEGYTGDTYCKGCNEVVEKGTTIKATGEHTYGDWKVVKEPTKTTKGEKQRTCSVCGHVDSKEIPVLSDTPATGDNSNIMLYSSMFTVSLAGLVVLLLAAKKRKQETA